MFAVLCSETGCLLKIFGMLYCKNRLHPLIVQIMALDETVF